MLMPSDLASRLERDWLPGAGGSYPADVLESGDRFAAAVAQWFANAMAATFPCGTAAARQRQLAATAASALAAGLAPASGQLLAVAVAGYIAGQSFGAGLATFPVALAAGIGLFTQAFVTRDLTQRARADLLAQGCYAMAVSTIVVFPVMPPPSPIF
jgi:hypothetical protein